MKLFNRVSAFLFVAIAALAMTGCGEYMVGEKVGTIIKLNQQGNLCKTWEGEMIRGGMNGGSGGFSATPFHFTIEDPELLAKAKESMEKGVELKVRYRQERATLCRSDSDDTFLTSLEPQKQEVIQAVPTNTNLRDLVRLEVREYFKELSRQ